MSDDVKTLMFERRERSWCLFLDRDGVVNARITDGYVRTWAEFEFLPGALDALATLARWAPQIVIVTNQQGIGKRLMSEADLADIHERMQRAVTVAGGRIDAVQWCPHLAEADCECRKPNPGMATRYLDAHPELDGALSIMVGDTDSDIEMGRRLAGYTGGCAVVRIGAHDGQRADATYPCLAAFAATVRALVADPS